MSESKRIFIRADANPNVGMGHIMRCLSIAECFSFAGHSVLFILADENIDELVMSRGYKTVVLHTDYQNMEEELLFWPEEPSDIIIVDSYFVTNHYFSNLKKMKLKEDGKLVYIDDLAAFPYLVDILVNYNVYGTELDYLNLYNKSNLPKLILGADYAPLRSMFRNVSRKEQKRKVTDVLISTGGSDYLHLALRIIQSNPSRFIYHILIGTLNSDKDEIERLAQSLPNIVLHENVIDMKSLIESCDIVVSAAGSTLYEICACGVPLITYILADNQIPGAKAFERLGLAVNCGDMRGVPDSAKKILEAVEQIADNYKYRCTVGIRMQNMIDGYGADRVVKRIMYPNICVDL